MHLYLNFVYYFSEALKISSSQRALVVFWRVVVFLCCFFFAEGCLIAGKPAHGREYLRKPHVKQGDVLQQN